MFRRELYRAMGDVLEALDGEALSKWKFRFGGGTFLALEHQEYRLSRDLDFLGSDAAGYAELRREVRGRGFDALFDAKRRSLVELPREPRVDQYGVRFPAIARGVSIRVELIREARIELGRAAKASWTALPVLSIRDAFAEKLLANSDRWADRDDLSRDLVDLAMLRDAHGPIPTDAWIAVNRAYASTPDEDLRRAATRFLAEPDYRERCFKGLDVDRPDEILRGVGSLLADLDRDPPAAESDPRDK